MSEEKKGIYEWCNNCKNGSQPKCGLHCIRSILKRANILISKPTWYESKEPESTYKIGQLFKAGYKLSKTVMLCRIDVDVVCAINLDNGNRWTEPIKVEDSSEITETELIKIFGNEGKSGEYELI